MTDKKYGNDRYWCFIPEKYSKKEVAIWKKNEEGGIIVARAIDAYEAQEIIDALLANFNNIDKSRLGKKETMFLEFVAANCVEPYATMASNAILWNDFETYNKLKSDFHVIYS